MKILGAVLAGGTSSRFGSDKALALHDGQPLIGHVIAGLTPQVAALVITGRNYPGYRCLPDQPTSGLGPLGGLCAALIHAAENDFDAVLSTPCDTFGLPADLATRLAPGPAIALGQRSIGLWPARLAPLLRAQLAGGNSRAIHRWAAACKARDVDCGHFPNINTPADLSQN
jgi:molybdopterin-guanine dinucleotide biosynthesis protein A